MGAEQSERVRLSYPWGMLRSVTDDMLSRSAVAAHRVVTHQLAGGAVATGDCAVLDTGVQDTPPGTTAAAALRARGVDPDDRDLVLVHSMRGTMHVHRSGDLPLFAAALRPEAAKDLLRQQHGTFFLDAEAAGVPPGEAFDEVAAAMREVMSDGDERSKGELSTALRPVVDERLRPWCEGCGVHHVHDGLFRFATLPAGLVLLPTGKGSARFARGRAVKARDPAVQAHDPTEARAELVRRYLRVAGPTTHQGLAAWLGMTPAAVRPWWRMVDTVPVSVEGRTLFMHSDDVEAARAAPRPEGEVRLPPYDPVLELGDRELLIRSPGDRKKVWRAVANPGVVLDAGEAVATWRTTKGKVTVTPLGAAT